MEWTNDTIFEFLNLYQNEPLLWNFTTPEHKNKSDAYDAWNRIKSKLKDGTIPIKEIKKKRDNLMSTYRRLRTKVRESIATGCGADEVYKPEWPFYTFMSKFLDDVYKPRKNKNSEDPLDIEDGEEDDNTSADDENEKASPFKTLQRIYNKPSKRNKLHDNDDTKHSPMKRKTDSDTCSLYCALLCNKLRALEENKRDIAMMEIDRIIYNLKQQDNHTMGLPYQGTIPSIIQQPYNYTQTASSSDSPNQSCVLPYSEQVPSAPGYPSNSQSPQQSSPSSPSGWVTCKLETESE